MKDRRKFNGINIHDLYPMQEDRFNYLKPDEQGRIDELVVSTLDWKPFRAFSPLRDDMSRRMWGTKGVLGTVGNLTAIRVLDSMGADWKSALLGEDIDDARLAA